MVTFYDCVMKRQRCRLILRYSEPALANLIPTKQTFATCLIFLLLGASFLTTLIFWEYIAVNSAQGSYQVLVLTRRSHKDGVCMRVWAGVGGYRSFEGRIFHSSV